jgi:cell wall-associated NlpC family hydrolase
MSNLSRTKMSNLSRNPLKLFYIAATFMAMTQTVAGQERRLFRPYVEHPSLISKAKAWEGKYYRKGVSCQCANWLGEVTSASGFTLPKGHSLARNWLSFGKPVNRSSLRSGDVIVTWRGSRHGSSGHVLIYLGDNQCIHRSTRNKPIQRISLDVYRGKILGIRRPTRK